MYKFKSQRNKGKTRKGYMYVFMYVFESKQKQKYWKKAGGDLRKTLHTKNFFLILWDFPLPFSLSVVCEIYPKQSERERGPLPSFIWLPEF